MILEDTFYRVEFVNSGEQTDVTFPALTTDAVEFLEHYGETYLLGKESRDLEVLRQFRDKFLVKNKTGKELKRLYYKYDDKMIELLNKNPVLKEAVKKLIINITPVLEYLVRGE